MRIYDATIIRMVGRLYKDLAFLPLCDLLYNCNILQRGIFSMKKLLVSALLLILSGTGIFGIGIQQPKISNDDISEYIRLKNKITLAITPTEPELYDRLRELYDKLKSEVKRLEHQISLSSEHTRPELYDRLIHLKAVLNY